MAWEAIEDFWARKQQNIIESWNERAEGNLSSASQILPCIVSPEVTAHPDSAVRSRTWDSAFLRSQVLPCCWSVNHTLRGKISVQSSSVDSHSGHILASPGELHKNCQYQCPALKNHLNQNSWGNLDKYHFNTHQWFQCAKDIRF